MLPLTTMLLLVSTISLHGHLEADSAEFVSAEKSMDETNCKATMPIDSHGMPSSPMSGSDTEGFAQLDDVTSQMVTSGLIDLSRLNGQ